MMKATGHKRCHTLTLLRHLKEWGYVVPVGGGKGPRNFSSLRIPLNVFGNITPEPMTPEQIAELRAKYARKSKRADQAQPPADDFDQAAEESQAQPPAAAPAAPATTDQARPFPAVAAALSTAIVPAPAPIPITPPPVALTPEEEAERDRQEQIAGWQERADYYLALRDEKRPNSRTWKFCDEQYHEALQALEEWKQAPVIFAPVPVPETAKGEYA